ncbi:MAG: DUF5615 family PIN-like protein [Pyrinomonadaceae bacterium]
MKLLLDECVPRRLRRKFEGFQVFTIDEAGFKGLKNGKLLLAASTDYEVLITVDKNLQYQQDVGNLPMAVVVLSAHTNRVEDLEPLIDKALQTLVTIRRGDFIEIER